jgi:hypothetical protein
MLPSISVPIHYLIILSLDHVSPELHTASLNKPQININKYLSEQDLQVASALLAPNRLTFQYSVCPRSKLGLTSLDPDTGAEIQTRYTQRLDKLRLLRA